MIEDDNSNILDGEEENKEEASKQLKKMKEVYISIKNAWKKAETINLDERLIYTCETSKYQQLNE